MRNEDANEEGGVFLRQNFNFRLNESVTHLKVQNEMMLIVLNGKRLEHVRLKNNSSSVVSLPLAGEDRVAHIHLDYTGVHALISTKNGDNFYLNMKSIKLSSLKRLKGFTISAVAWSFDFVKSNETGFIILGTTKGTVIEVNIANTNCSTPTFTHFKNWENVLCLDTKLSISEIYFCQCLDDEDKYILFICMPGRLYVLCESVNFDTMTQSTAATPVVGTVWSMAMAEQSSAVLQQFFSFNKNQLPRYHNYNSETEEQTSLLNAFVVYPIAFNESPRKFCWATNEGLSYGRIDLSARNVCVKDCPNDGETTGNVTFATTSNNAKSPSSDAYDIIKKEAFIKFKKVDDRTDYSINISMTEYHILTLHSEHFTAFSLINQSVAFEELFTKPSDSSTYIAPIGMVRDEASQLIWVFTDSNIFFYRPNDETRYIWRIYLEQKDFGKARKLTSVLKNQTPYQLVIRREAEKFIGEKNYVAAAEILAESSDSFETIVLNFLKSGTESRNGLKRFLELKLNHMLQPRDAIKRDVLVIWLLEIQLSELAELKLNNRHQQLKAPFKKTTSTSTLALSLKDEDGIVDSSDSTSLQDADLNKLRKELYCFLNRKIVSETINTNRAAIYRMMSTRVDFETQLYLAKQLKDYDVMLKIMLLQCQFADILEVLVSQAKPAFYYKYAPDLISEIPVELVKALIENQKILSTSRLLPAFYKCFEDVETMVNSKVIAATFYYFDQIINGKTDRNFVGQSPAATKNVYNFVINLYASFKPKNLIDCLKRFGKQYSKLPYDLDCALRNCLDKGLSECAIYLYCVEGLYEEAVKLALTISVDLARQCAIEMNKASDDSGMLNDEFGAIFEVLFLDDDDFQPKKNLSLEQRKQIWLQIVQHLCANINGADSNDNVKACMSLLNESNGVLKLQDVLSYFPDFTSIKHFKEPLCMYLKEHSKMIQNLQKEMTETADMANKIHGELEKNKSKFMIVKMSDKCFFCKESLLSRPFFAFFCRHFVHKICAEKHLLQSEFSKNEKVLYAKMIMEEKLLCKELQMAMDAQNLKEKLELTVNLQRVRAELKRLLAEDCPLCGVRIINSIDKPFLTEEEYEKEAKVCMV